MNVPINSSDIVVLIILFFLLGYGVKLVIGFFHEGKRELKQTTYNGKGKVKMTLLVDGMMCGQCEAHVSDAIRKEFEVEKVTSSHTKGETVIIAKHDIDRDALADTIAKTGYILKDIEKENYRGNRFSLKRV